MNRRLRNGIVLAALIAASLFAWAAGPAAAPATMDKLELRISADGRAIVDQNGKPVAHFVDDLRVKASAQKTRLQGCMCCEKECIVYDNKGRCVKSIDSCTWDFDCSCR
ncbi:MAG: hypothetical protein ACM3Y9_16780 [Ignavibacteria bacterium]